MILTAVTFFVILSILVLVHELGHFLVARFFGVDVEEFGLGLPPRIFGKKVRGTMYSVNWLPIGGFVKLAGEDDEEKGQQKGKVLFWQKTKKQRAAILLAGVAMNFFLAVGITSYLLTQGVMEPSGRVHIERVLEETPAAAAGLMENDVIAKLDDKEITKPSDLIDATKSLAGQAVTLTVIRENREFQVSVTPRKEYPQGQGPMGVAISDLEKKTYPISIAPIKSLEINLLRGRDMLGSLGILFWRLITLQPLQADVAGPIGIA